MIDIDLVKIKTSYQSWIKDLPKQNQDCTLIKPMLICIPAEGIHVSCPVHPEGHFMIGKQITC